MESIKKPLNYKFIIINDTKHNLTDKVNELISEGKEILETSICQDFEEHGNVKKFILTVYYK